MRHVRVTVGSQTFIAAFPDEESERLFTQCVDLPGCEAMLSVDVVEWGEVVRQVKVRASSVDMYEMLV